MSKQGNNLQPVYFFVGEDALKRGVLEDRLRARIARLGDIDFNFQAFDGNRDKVADVISACQTMPFLNDYRLVIVRQAEGFSSSDAKALVTYIDDPNATTVLALSSSGFESRSALSKAFSQAPKEAVVDCSIGDLPNLVRSLATSHGIVIAPAAAAALIDLAGSDTVHLDGELEKLALAHEGSDPVTVEEVQRFIAPIASKDFKPWEFLDALSARDSAKCFRILSGVDDGELVRLLSLSVGRMKELLAATSDSCSTASSLAAALGKKDWQVKNHHRWARAVKPEAIERAIVSASETESAMKSGADAREAFVSWLCDWFASVSPNVRR